MATGRTAAGMDDAAVDVVRTRIQQHLRERGVFESLRSIVSDAMGTPQDGGPSALAAEKSAARALAASALQRGAAEGSEAPEHHAGFLIHCELLGGRAFFDADARGAARGAEAPRTLRASVQLGEARFETAPTPQCSEPALEGSFYLPLSLAGGGGHASDAPEQLLRARTPLHLLVMPSQLNVAPIKHGRFPIEHGRFPIDHRRFAI
jgi:hypothetical protein